MAQSSQHQGKTGLYWPGEEGTLLGKTTSRVCSLKWGRVTSPV